MENVSEKLVRYIAFHFAASQRSSDHVVLDQSININTGTGRFIRKRGETLCIRGNKLQGKLDRAGEWRGICRRCLILVVRHNIEQAGEASVLFDGPKRGAA